MKPAYRDPANLAATDVCPHCMRSTIVYRTMASDGVWLETHHCKGCGDVVPLRKPKESITDWSAS